MTPDHGTLAQEGGLAGHPGMYTHHTRPQEEYHRPLYIFFIGITITVVLVMSSALTRVEVREAIRVERGFDDVIYGGDGGHDAPDHTHNDDLHQEHLLP